MPFTDSDHDPDDGTDNWRRIGEVADEVVEGVIQRLRAKGSAAIDRIRLPAEFTVPAVIENQRTQLRKLQDALDLANRQLRDLTLAHEREKRRADMAEAVLRSHGHELA